MKFLAMTICMAATLMAATAADRANGGGQTAATATATTTAPAEKKPATNLELWLSEGEKIPAASQPAGAQPARSGASPFGPKGPDRAEAVPGVIELSDGRRLAGELSTTVEKPWLVWVPSRKRWRRVPLIALLGFGAVVVEEKMELSWRWKAMGEPERVYTGGKYPTRRFDWKFHLIDDSYITGSVKGQPLWVRGPDGKRHGPFVLHERSKGVEGQNLKDMVYVRQVIISRKMMDMVLADQKRHATKNN